MSFLFFLLALVSAALSFNVLRPIFHHTKWIVPSFAAGWLVGELAIHAILVQLAVVLLFVMGGVVSGFWGAVSILLWVSSWLALAYHYLSGYKAKTLMDNIVRPHRTQGDDSGQWSKHRALDVQRFLRPRSGWQDPEVEVIKNIPFAEIDGLKMKLDIRRHRQPADNAPVLVQIHGGAWTFGYGSKNEQGLPLAVEMAKRGWIVVSISYRLYPKVVLPEQAIDCKRAIVWIKQHIAGYGGNPEFLVLTGGSAGGHLSSLLALTPDVKALQPGFEQQDTRVQGCVPFYGIYDLLDSQHLQLSAGLSILMRKKIIGQSKTENPELYALVSPISHVCESAPPFLIIHGDKDSLTSLGEAQYFASQLDQISEQSVEFAEIAGAQHAFDVFPSLRSDYVMLGVAERLQQWHQDFVSKQ